MKDTIMALQGWKMAKRLEISDLGRRGVVLFM